MGGKGQAALVSFQEKNQREYMKSLIPQLTLKPLVPILLLLPAVIGEPAVFYYFVPYTGIMGVNGRGKSFRVFLWSYGMHSTAGDTAIPLERKGFRESVEISINKSMTPKLSTLAFWTAKGPIPGIFFIFYLQDG